MSRRRIRRQQLICGVLVFCIVQMIDTKWNFLNLNKYLSQDLLRGTTNKHGDQLTNKGREIHVHYHGEQFAEKSSDHPDLRIIILVYNRPYSLERLLISLNAAEYFDDKIILEVWIDRSKDDGMIDHGTYYTASKFKFDHGEYRVHNHTKHVGIYGQWMGTWNPAPDSSEIAVILEDDLTVSRHFYRWLKNVHKKYDDLPNLDLAGYSLQGRSIKHGGAAGLLRGPERDVCFLYPILGTWGYSPHRRNWFRFIDWYRNASRDPTFQPLVPGLVPTDWWRILQQKGQADEMWSMWHIFHAWNEKLWTLYPNLKHSQGLSINWKEAGLHYSKQQTSSNKTADPILQDWASEYDDLPWSPGRIDINGRVLHFKAQ